MKSTRYMFLFLALCFSVFLGHNLIPHHHHSELVEIPVAADCPINHGDHHEHDAEGSPLHCHAFNDVAFEKYNVPKIHSETRELHTFILPQNLDLAQQALPGIFYRSGQIKILAISAAFISSRALRAPPKLPSFT